MRAVLTGSAQFLFHSHRPGACFWELALKKFYRLHSLYFLCQDSACYVARMWPNSLHTLMTQPDSNELCKENVITSTLWKPNEFCSQPPRGSAPSNVGQVLPRPPEPGWESETVPTAGRGKGKVNSVLFHSPARRLCLALPKHSLRGVSQGLGRTYIVRSTLRELAEWLPLTLRKGSRHPPRGCVKKPDFWLIGLWFVGHSIFWGKKENLLSFWRNPRKSCN